MNEERKIKTYNGLSFVPLNVYEAPTVRLIVNLISLDPFVIIGIVNLLSKFLS